MLQSYAMAALTPEDQELAARLYLSGKSARQVAEHFGVSLNATFYALRRRNVARRTPQESNRIQFESKAPSFCIKEGLTPQEERLKLAAVMLYWAEGYKAGKMQTVDFTNSDPDMALVFIRFLRRVCGVDEQKLRCSIYCYEGQNVATLTRFWSVLLDIPAVQFNKPYVKKAAKPGPRGPRMTHGLVHIRYCDKKLLRQILDWIEEYKLECVGGGVVNRDWL